MGAMFEQSSVTGLVVTYMETVLEHGGLHIVAFVLFFNGKVLYLFIGDTLRISHGMW